MAELTEWRERALEAAASALKERERDDRDDEIARLKSKVGEITMDNELLYAKIAAMEGKRPLAQREAETMSQTFSPSFARRYARLEQRTRLGAASVDIACLEVDFFQNVVPRQPVYIGLIADQNLIPWCLLCEGPCFSASKSPAIAPTSRSSKQASRRRGAPERHRHPRPRRRVGASGALASLLASGASSPIRCCSSTRSTRTPKGRCRPRPTHRRAAAVRQDWEQLGIGGVLAELLKDRAFEFAVERAVFVATLHRLFVSGSDRDCSSWMEDYDIAGSDGLDLHHFYRAMAWFGEEMEEKSEDALAPRCVKDVIEQKLFGKRRDLFCDLSAVFMDTTSLSFLGNPDDLFKIARSFRSASNISAISCSEADF